MGTDIFSNYINNLNNHKSPQQVEINQQSENLNKSSYEVEHIHALKEISNKLDKFNQIIATPKAVIPMNVASEVESNITVDIAIENGFVVLPDNGIFSMNIYIKNGKIHSIGNNLKLKANRIIDATNKYVMPGIIDPHVHLGLFAPLDEELATETQAALIGGITTIGCYFASPKSHLATFPQIIEDIGRRSYTDIIPHLVISSEEQKRDIVNYIDNLGVTSFKVYMNGIPGLIPDVDDGFILDVFDEIKKSNKNCIVCAHAENRYLVQRANKMVLEEKGKNATVHDWTDTHPDMAEEEAVIRLSYLAGKSKVPVYFVHISSKSAIDRLRAIKPYNKYINVETTSPYLSLTKNSSNNNDIKMEPPFRDTKDLDELWKAVEENIIDSIGTDNVTMTKSEKKIDEDIWTAIPGYSVIQTHLPVLLNEGIAKKGLMLDQLISKITKRPAQLFGVYPQKGTILPGSDADVIIVDMNLTKEVNAKELSSRSDFSIYEGKTLKGWPVMTIKSGEVVVENGKFIGSRSSGKCLHR